MDPLLAIGALRVTDGVVLVLLLLFGVWGAMRGALRQSLSILILVGALYAASPLAPHLAPTVGKVSGLVGEEQTAVAWLAAFVGALIVGAILLAFLTPRMPERRGPAWWGGLLGIVKGSVVLVILAYFVLGGVGGDLPGLRRDGAPRGPGLVERLRGSVSASLLTRGSEAITRLVNVPPWIQSRVATVNAELAADAPPTRRPKGP